MQICFFFSVLSIKELDVGFNGGSLKALRAMRVLRPLKLVSGIPSKCFDWNETRINVNVIFCFISGFCSRNQESRIMHYKLWTIAASFYLDPPLFPQIFLIFTLSQRSFLFNIISIKGLFSAHKHTGNGAVKVTALQKEINFQNSFFSSQKSALI